MRRILVSACLLGQPVRYDGGDKRVAHPALARWAAEGRLVPFCPECAAGLPTPRPAAEIAPGDEAAAVLAGSGRVRDNAGGDHSAAFRAAARLACAAAEANRCAFALLADRSPSCGVRMIHAGRFDGALRPGMGIAALALARQGVRVFSEAEIDALAAALEA